MEENTNNLNHTPLPSHMLNQPLEMPQIIEEHEVTATSSKSYPMLMILSTLAVFIVTGAVLLYNSKRTSDASYRPQVTYTREKGLQERPTVPVAVETTLTPTQASSEESTVNNITIDDGTSDYSSLDQTASGL